MKPFLLIIFLIFINIVNAGTIDPSIDDSKYIEYGKKFKYVYKICGTYEDGQLFCASAVAIDKNWVLTAAHVVNGARTAIVSQDDKAFLVKEIICSENFQSNSFGYGDIAICYIKDDLGLDFYPPLYDKDDELDKICCISGYGITGDFNTGSKLADGKKRAGSNKIIRTERDLLVCDATRRSNRGHTELEFLIASGDSGGGLFIDGKLAGINSCVMTDDKNPNSNYGDESGHTRISKYVQWIKTNLLKRK